MLGNFHTHTTFCDGKNTAEEVVLSAIEKGFDSIGFSGHGYTGFDHTYCMMDTDGYLNEISRLKNIYAGKIQIYAGIEEDAFYPLDRTKFNYIIGSSHYFCVDGKYYPIDSSYDGFKTCLGLFNSDVLALAENYYKRFCSYILKRKPDIIGHFDLITKFDEIDVPRFLDNKKYTEIAEKYLLEALKSDSFFEVNTGAISRGYRKAPYPSENLLYTLKKNGGRLILSADSHAVDTIDFYFKETKTMLKNIGFEYVYILYNNSFIKDYL